MRIAILVLLFLLAACWVVTAGADPDDLSGGVFIAHHAPTALYSEGADWCEAYHSSGYGIENCEEQIHSMSSGVEQLWYVVAAFPLEEKVWCGTEFGFAGITADIEFIEWGPCLEHHLEITYGPWPGSYSGTVVVAEDQDDGWSGNFLPVYSFWTVSYAGGTVPLDVDPSVNFGGFANCEVPTTTWDAICYGVMGVDEAGEACCPDFGACCLPSGACEEMSAPECPAAGGVYYGGPCDPNPCPDPQLAACCVDDACTVLSEYDCDLLGGDWYGAIEDCDPNPCIYGACCLCSGSCTLTDGEDVCHSYGGIFLGIGLACDPNPCPTSQYCWPCCVGADCLIVSEEGCAYYLGEFHPEYEDCDPNPCGPVETREESWGSIKSRFR